MPERDVSFEGKKKKITLILIPLAHHNIPSHLCIKWVIGHALIKTGSCF